MALAVRRRSVTAEAPVRSQVNPCGIFGGQSGNGIGFSPSISVLPCQFHFTGAPLHGKRKGQNLSSSSQCCTISIQAAVRPLHLLRGPSPQKGKLGPMCAAVYTGISYTDLTI
jgi:hypothetical protein